MILLMKRSNHGTTSTQIILGSKRGSSIKVGLLEVTITLELASQNIIIWIYKFLPKVASSLNAL